MRTFILLMAFAISCLGCGKEKPAGDIDYTTFNDNLVSYHHPLLIDLDKDGENDFLITINLINFNNEDHLQFIVTSTKGNRILLQEEQLPKRMNQDEVITGNEEPPFVWTALESAILVEKITPQDVSSSYWQGSWKNQNKKFLPVQLVKGISKYNGWIRLSFSEGSTEGIIVHDAAYNKRAGASITTGPH